MLAGVNPHGEDQPEGVHEEMALAALDLLARVVADIAPVAVALHALAVEDARTGPAVVARRRAHHSADPVVELTPEALAAPAAEDMVDGLPRREAPGKQAPLDAAFDEVKHRVEDPAEIGPGPSASGRLGKMGKQQHPLGVAQVGRKTGVLHRPNSAAAHGSKPFPAGRCQASDLSLSPPTRAGFFSDRL